MVPSPPTTSTRRPAKRGHTHLSGAPKFRLPQLARAAQKPKARSLHQENAKGVLNLGPTWDVSEQAQGCFWLLLGQLNYLWKQKHLCSAPADSHIPQS